jgi:hypothetical protein
VADVGLTVDWSNSGPRAGAGSVETSCGPVDVEIDEIDGVLWIRWEENREVATHDAIQALLSCSPLHEEGEMVMAAAYGIGALVPLAPLMLPLVGRTAAVVQRWS